MNKGVWFLIALVLCSASTASAAPITYNVTVDSSSISGTAGSLDFNFNPGPFATQSAYLQILDFTSDGALAGSPMLTGDVHGALPGTVTFDNGTSFNDYFEGFTYGSTLSFQVSLYGPALSSPDGSSTSGSTFAFSMFSNVAGTMSVLTTNPSGFAFTIDVNLDGTTTVTNFSPQTTVSVPAPSIGHGLPVLLTVSTLFLTLTSWNLPKRWIASRLLKKSLAFGDEA